MLLSGSRTIADSELEAGTVRPQQGRNYGLDSSFNVLQFILHANTHSHMHARTHTQHTHTHTRNDSDIHIQICMHTYITPFAHTVLYPPLPCSVTVKPNCSLSMLMGTCPTISVKTNLHLISLSQKCQNEVRYWL